ncbi:universal stress protein [Chitinophaga polysaccharea]|uniref:universal stress protein n=1 Tax=Chitinophaga TaxID=79328 RepID=UPI001455DAE7|nr:MULTISPECIES: universal stress protein [Chitinophaga]NLR56839.1 universal stress protein [Chitinophaga polysaccharea]NLU93062.1 universal stress protein [Chitinophaga sp. Ak27]
MKKIIVVLDGLRFRQNAVDYAIAITKSEKSHLVGIFLEDFSYRSYGLYELVDETGAVTDKRIATLSEHDKNLRDSAVARFEESCQRAGLNYSVHRNTNIAIEELLHESIYADLLVIDSHESFTRSQEEAPSRFIRHLLADAACPVLMVPNSYQPIGKIVFLFDSTPASVQAVRMFDYLLPGMKHLPAEVIAVKSAHEDFHLPDGKLMKEFMKRHFPDAHYNVLKGIPEDEIVQQINEMRGNVLIVLGAYTRSGLSRWLNPSMADTLVEGTSAPLFIAHSK